VPSASAEWLDEACDLCSWAQEEGFPAFVIFAPEDGAASYVGPKLPTSLVVKMLRAAADAYENQVPDRALN
jgi:hypothetical protein